MGAESNPYLSSFLKFSQPCLKLRHTDIQTTMNIYAHVSQQKKEQTADTFAKYISF